MFVQANILLLVLLKTGNNFLMELKFLSQQMMIQFFFNLKYHSFGLVYKWCNQVPRGEDID